MSRGKLWVFSGLDGAGKTTQIDLLLKEIGQRKGRRLWTRVGYTPGFSTLKSLIRALSRAEYVPKSGHSAARTQMFRSPWVKRVWLTLSMLDLFLYLGVWARILLLAGREVVADRWFIDSEIDLSLNFPDDHPEKSVLWRLILRVLPEPNAHFVFLIEVDESLRRSQLKQEPFPDSKAVLLQRYTLYREFIANSNAIEIDGSQSIELVRRDVEVSQQESI